jgi:LysM repeat protein
MYARSQLLIWTAIIFVLNLVLLVKLRDNAATARTQLEELTPTELSQINIADMFDSDALTSREESDESVVYEDQGSEMIAERSEGSPQFSLFPENTSAGSATVYYVHKGDTLWNISRTHNLDLRTLLTYNKLKDPNLIRPGQRIAIPRRHANMQVSP